MEIEAISEEGYSSGKYLQITDAIVWNGMEVELKDQLKSNDSSFATTILTSFQMPSSGKSFKIAPMGGSASVSAEKDSDGNTTAEAEITVSSEDGTFEVSGSASVDQDGNTSGKIEASINWQKD